jgi:hypothetical protein
MTRQSQRRVRFVAPVELEVAGIDLILFDQLQASPEHCQQHAEGQ